MRFGDYIRDVRRRLNWTQPDAAREIGIEQSYLSKLESGKSYPSEDIFTSIIDRYSIDVSDLTDALFAGELDRLRDVSQVRDYILRSQRDQARQTQRLLIAGTLALTLGGACLGAATLASDTDQIVYQYRSTLPSVPTDASIDATALEQQSADLEGEFRTLDVYRDVMFTEATDAGPRTWRLIGSSTRSVRSPLRWFMVPAMALIFSAIGLFFMSYRSR